MLGDVQRFNYKNWASAVRDMLQGLGYGQFWLDQHVENEKWFLCSIEQRMKDQYAQHWHNFINTSRKALYYREFKENISYESYLDLPIQIRIPLSQFRCCSHGLLVESGRWMRPIIPYEQRLSTLQYESY